MGIIDLTAFTFASFLFIISPGIDTIFILNRSVVQGPKAGLIATLGITTGVLVHTTLAAFGLSLILAQSAMAFSLVKYLGAAYLIYLGISKLFLRESLLKEPHHIKAIPLRKTYFSAVFTNVLNPKVAIFFLAFFPQFIQPAFIRSATPFVTLGFIYACIGLVWFTMLTFFAGFFSDRLKNSPTITSWINKCSAIAFILMGIKIAVTKR